MHSFLIDEVPQGEILLPPEQAHHALRVLRLGPGDKVHLSDGKGRLWEGKVLSCQDGQVRCLVEEELPGRESPVSITLYQGLPKSDKLELIAQKITELGVNRLVPVAMSRSVAKWEGKEIAKKQERLTRIAQEALKQCGRSRALEVAPLMSWNQALSDMKERQLMLMPWEETRDGRMAEVYNERADARDIGLLIGPEGGISEKEALQAQEQGAIPITLGPRILRCETAAICSCAMAQQLWGDL